MVDWNAEIAIYNDPSQNNTEWYDPSLGCTHYSANFQGALLALLDTGVNPLCAAMDIEGFSYYVNTPRNGNSSDVMNTRAWAAVSKAVALEKAYGLSGAPLSGALYAGIDALSGMTNIEGFVLSSCGSPDRAVQATNQTCIEAVRNQISGFRTDIVNFFDALQSVEAAAVPTAPVTPVGPVAAVPAVLAGPEVVGGLGEEIPGTDLATLYSLLVVEYTYQGVYKSIPNLQVPANQTYYPVDVGFPVRVFWLNSDLPITVYLQDPAGDPFYLDYQSTPFKMKKISGGLAFDTIYVTNTNNVAATLFLFAMG